RNFQTNSWTPLFTTNQTGSACTTDTEYAYAFNQYTITGFNLFDHISQSGEIWVRFLTNNPATIYNIQFDRIYLMLGSVNTNSLACEISWGTGTASDCANTRDTREAIGATPVTPTFQVTTELEYPTRVGGYYGFDNDDDATNGEAALSANIDFPIQIATNTAITAIHYAVKYRSNNTALTVDLQIRNYSGNHPNSGAGTGSGWDNTPGTDTNAATTYSYFDTWRLSEEQINADDRVDTVNNRANLRLRTSVSTLTTSATSDWDFAMMSIRWVEVPSPPSSTISCNFSTSSTSFINLSPSNVSTSSPDITITVTSSANFQISVKDQGNGILPGLYKSTIPTYFIPSPNSSYNATATLNPEVDGYGIQATTSASEIN
ncbi:MAG: hypothetical protein NZ822_03355, partial [Patescibacteria group bacterium]|nr:hypothetical protein [Patescibacteria group bacterium]